MRLFVFSVEPPTFVGNLRMETLGEYGSNVRISCDTIGVPQPKISWYRNAEPIGQNIRYLHMIRKEEKT